MHPNTTRLMSDLMRTKGLLAWIGMVAVWVFVAAGQCMAQSLATLDDGFDGSKLNNAAWIKGGSNNPVQTVRDGSLRLIATGMTNQAFIASKSADFNFFKQPISVVWDLVSKKTLAGPYAATNNSKAYAGLSIGADSVTDGSGAQLALTAWPEGFPRPQSWESPWYYTLSVGALMPKQPDADMRLSAMPTRIIWSLDATTWTVTIEGAKFITGNPQTRSGQLTLKESDFADTGFHLLMFTSPHVVSMEPGAKHIWSAVYTDRICVGPSGKIPAYVAGYKDETISPTLLKDLVGKDYSVPARGSKPQFLFGINYAGGTFRREQGFIPPTEESLDYWKSRGVMLMRLPIDWEGLQPKVNEPLDEKYLAAIVKTVQMMDQRGMKVILDLHNYGFHNRKIIGSAEVPMSAIGDVWKRLAEVFKGNKAIWGYGLMNEPTGRLDGREFSQVCVDAIRSIGDNTPILVSGSNWDKQWPDPTVMKDPANNLVWEDHEYCDQNHSGQYNFSFEYELNRPDTNLDPMVGVKRLEPFVKWLKKHNVKGLIGEFSVPANFDRDPRWLIVLDNMYQYLRENEVPSTYWAAGTLWTTERCYVIEPYWRDGPYRGVDRPQVHIMLKHARAYAGEADAK